VQVLANEHHTGARWLTKNEKVVAVRIAENASPVFGQPVRDGLADEVSNCRGEALLPARAGDIRSRIIRGISMAKADAYSNKPLKSTEGAR